MFEDNPGNAPQTGATPCPASFPNAAGTSSRVSGAPGRSCALPDARAVGRGLLRRAAAALLLALPVLAALAPAAEARPGQPGGFSATVIDGRNAIDFSWTTPTNTGGTALIRYEIQWREDATGNWVQFPETGSKDINNPAATSATLTDADGLQPNTDYDFRIRVFNSDSTPNSYFTADVEERTGGMALTAPGVPVLRAAGGHELVNGMSAGIEFRWGAPVDDGGREVTGYDWRWRKQGEASYRAPIRVGPGASYVRVPEATGDTAYLFQVRAVNALGAGSYDGLTVLERPAAPRNLRVAVNGAGTEAELSWTQNARMHWSIEQAEVTGSGCGSYGAPPRFQGAASYTASSLASGRHYCFRVQAVTDFRRSLPAIVRTDGVVERQPDPPAPPPSPNPPPNPNPPPDPEPAERPARVTGVTVTPGVGALAVRWNAAAGAARYRVQWKLASQSNYDASPQAETAGTSHTIPGLMAGTDYTVRVTATNSAGDGPASADAGPASPTAALRVARTDPARLTEDNVHGATVTVRLLGAAWETSIPARSVTVTGLPDGMTASEQPERVSDSEARITLSYTPPEGVDGLDGDARLTVTAAAASHSWTEDLTARVTVHARRAPAALAAVRWLSRFGRTVADHVMAAVGARLSEPAGQGDRLRLAGHRVSAPAALLTPPPAGREGSGEGLPARRTPDGASPAGLAAGPLTRPLPASGERGIAAAQTLAARDLLAGTSFRVSAVGGEGMADMGWTAWGRVDLSGFDGDEGGLSLDGDTMTATVGADMRRGRLLAGVAAAHSSGSGEYRDVGGTAGDLDASLASVHPYVRIEAAGGLSLWGVLGWGGGDMTLDRRDGDREKADLEMTMAGAGARGPLPSPSDGMALALRAEAFASRIEADGGGDALKGAEAEAWRMRLALEASWDETEAGLRPSAELGLRHDGGDGETGTGAELGGGVAWAGPDGVSASLRARALLDGDGVSEWGGGAMLAYAPGADGRGLRLSLAPTVGAPEGGAERLWRADAAALAGDERDAAPRLDAEAGWGLAALGGRGLLTPYAGLALSDADDRRYRLGARLTLAPGADAGLAAERSETASGPEHALTLDARLRW